ncbi:MAG TPA: hypothetical protein VIO57_15630 [Chloroflexota bacterium]
MNVRHVFGILERLILGAVMGAILFVVERMLTSPGDLQRVQRVQRLLRRVSDRR